MIARSNSKRGINTNGINLHPNKVKSGIKDDESILCATPP